LRCRCRWRGSFSLHGWGVGVDGGGSCSVLGWGAGGGGGGTCSLLLWGTVGGGWGNGNEEPVQFWKMNQFVEYRWKKISKRVEISNLV